MQHLCNRVGVETWPAEMAEVKVLVNGHFQYFSASYCMHASRPLRSSTMQQIKSSAIVDAWHAIWDRGDVNAFDDITAPGYTRLSTSSQSETTLDELKAEVLAIKAGFPDLRTVVDAVVVEGDTAAIFWSSEGTHTEPFLGVPRPGDGSGPAAPTSRAWSTARSCPRQSPGTAANCWRISE